MPYDKDTRYGRGAPALFSLRGKWLEELYTPHPAALVLRKVLRKVQSGEQSRVPRYKPKKKNAKREGFATILG